jgi:hypothetical protein
MTVTITVRSKMARTVARADIRNCDRGRGNSSSKDNGNCDKDRDKRQ